MTVHLRTIGLLCILNFNVIVSAALADTNYDLRRQYYKLLKSELDIQVWGPSVAVMVRNANEEVNNKRLEKLIVDLSKSGILKITNFKTKVIDLSQLEMVWEKDIEFNNSSFEDMFKKSTFETLFVVDYSSTLNGFEISLNLYAMHEDQIGSVIASVPATMLVFDWKAHEEVEILTASESKLLNEKIDAVFNQQLIVENAATFEQHFANYKLLEARDQRLESLDSLIEAIKLKPYLVDLVQTATQLSRSYFGSDANIYLKDGLYPSLDHELEKYSRLLLDPNFEIFDDCDLDVPRLNQCSISVDGIRFPQLLNLFLKIQGRRFAQNKKNWGVREVREYILLQASRRVIEDYKDGSFSNNYFDKVKASTDIDIRLALDIEAELNTAGYDQIKVLNYVLGSGSEWTLPEMEIVDEGGLKQLLFKEQEETSKSKLLKTRYQTTGLSVFDYDKKSFTPFREKISLLDFYFPARFMVGGAKDKIAFFDIFDLGPCEISKGGSVGYSVGDPSSYVSYFISLEEKQNFIKRQIEYQKESTDSGYPNIKDFDKALEYWNDIPILEGHEINNTVDIFAVDYPLQSGKYLPNNTKIKNYYGNFVKQHADLFFASYSDRLLWADFCILSMMRNAQENYKIDDYVKLRYLDDGTPVFDFSAISGLFITDSVDVNQPILLNTNMYGENSANWARLDISKDGTLFDPNGLNLDTSQFARSLGFDVLHSNDWLYVPGIVQSSIGLNEIHEIQYTDIYGNKKTVYPKKGNGRSSGGQDIGGEINRMDDWYLDDEHILKPKAQFMKNWEYNLELFAAMKIDLSIPNYVQKAEESFEIPKTFPPVQVSEIKTIFYSERMRWRRYIQESLRTLGVYKGTIDGKWGKGTEAGFQQLFNYLDRYYPYRQYVSDYGFDDGEITRDEFMIFWNSMYGCNDEQLLSITSACGK